MSRILEADLGGGLGRKNQEELGDVRRSIVGVLSSQDCFYDLNLIVVKETSK